MRIDLSGSEEINASNEWLWAGLNDPEVLTHLFISHDLKVVRALANDFIVTRDGKVVEYGPSAEVFDRPKTDYTKALMAAAFEIATAPAGVVGPFRCR